MKIEVHLQGGLRKIIDITPGATVGATIGKNVFNADGTLFVPAQPGNTSQLSITSWELILNIPPNVTALANTATTGLYAITAAGASATRSITPVAGETTVTNGDGVAGDPQIGLADVTPSAGGSIQRLGFDAKGRRSQADTATTDNLPEGAANLYFTDARAQAAVVVPTIVDGDTTHSPSGDAVFDALAGKDDAGSAAAALAAANAYTDAEIAALELSSGTWIPTLFNTTNVTSSTVGVGQWIRVGDVVNFSIRVSAQAASGSSGTPVATLLGVSMPVAADLTAANQVAGNATIGESPYVSGQVVADTVNDRFSLNWFATSTSNRAITITGTYRLA